MGLLCPPPEKIEPASLMSPALAGGSFTTSAALRTIIILLFVVVVVVQSLSHVRLFVTPWTAACQDSVFHYLPEFAQTHVH